MDILNFISWIKGKRQVTSVDPTKTLIPVGLKDGRRDDDYLAGAISVEDLATQIAPPPTPNTNIYNSNGTLTTSRTVDANNYDLVFSNLNFFGLYSNSSIQMSCASTQINFGPSGALTINKSAGGPVALSIDFATSVYKFGQVTGGNATQLKIDDAAAYPVQVSGTNVSANTAGTSSGQFLKINVNGVNYKIDLLNL